MAEERRKVTQQEGRTPGRRGEEIKQEEIDKEIVRREMLKQKNKNPERYLTQIYSSKWIEQFFVLIIIN